jgi:hypothetical protein
VQSQTALVKLVACLLSRTRRDIVMALDGVNELPPFSVDVRNGLVNLGFLPAGGEPAGRVPLDLFTDLPNGMATVRLVERGQLTLAPGAAGEEPTEPRLLLAPILALESPAGSERYRISNRLIPIRRGQAARAMDYVSALAAGSCGLAPIVSRLEAVFGELSSGRDTLLLGHATAHWHVRVHLPPELRDHASPSLPFELDFPLRDTHDLDQGVLVRLAAGGISAYYQFSSGGRHTRLVGMHEATWPALFDYCLALADSGFDAAGARRADTAPDAGATRRLERLATALLTSTSELELTASSALRLGRAGDRSLEVLLAGLPPHAKVRLWAERVDPNGNVSLVLEHGAVQVRLELMAQPLRSYAARLAAPEQAGKAGPALVLSEPVAQPAVVRVTENELRRHFLRSQHVFEDLRRRLQKEIGSTEPPAAGRTATLSGVLFTAVGAGGRSGTWSFADDRDVLLAVARIGDYTLVPGEKPPWCGADEVVLNDDLKAKNSRRLLPDLVGRLGNPRDYPGLELVLARRGVAVRFFKRRLSSGGKPSVVWTFRTGATGTLNAWAEQLR